MNLQLENTAEKNMIVIYFHCKQRHSFWGANLRENLSLESLELSLDNLKDYSRIKVRTCFIIKSSTRYMWIIHRLFLPCLQVKKT